MSRRARAGRDSTIRGILNEMFHCQRETAPEPRDPSEFPTARRGSQPRHHGCSPGQCPASPHESSDRSILDISLMDSPTIDTSATNCLPSAQLHNVGASVNRSPPIHLTLMSTTSARPCGTERMGKLEQALVACSMRRLTQGVN